MNCWHCERPAHGTCAFCGRAVCKAHAQSLPNILALYTGTGGVKKAIVVGNALFCGACSPNETPVEMKELD
ncbi:MAG: hypothetical protein HY720_16095 [Planctomycetes bacterium]|nr:hypothetical protein [Planctomycetota bacterium]